MTIDMLEAALEYASIGWAVFPLHTPTGPASCDCGEKEKCSSIAKHPRTKRGLLDATTDEKQIRRWWTMWPKANIGINCGMSGLVVMDIDPRHGGDESWADLVQQHGTALQDTLDAKTGGGGNHKVFSADPANPFSNSASAIAPGIDVRAVGGYIVAAPSRHESGKRYAWLESPLDRDPAPMPAALVKLLSSSRTSSTAGAVGDTIPEGRRNNTLASLAGTMRNRGMSEAEILAALEVTNATRCIPPLPPDEVAKIAESYGRYEPGRGAFAANRSAEDRHGDYDHSDTGNAELLVDTYGADLRHDADQGRLLRWATGLRWQELSQSDRHQLAMKAAGKRYEHCAEMDSAGAKAEATFARQSRDLRRIESMLTLATSLSPVADPSIRWDEQPDLLAVGNGVVDLRTGHLRAGLRSDYLSRGIELDFDPAATCPRWCQFISEITLGDCDLADFLQRAIGYSLTGHIVEHVFLVCHGNGANGKSTLLNILRRLLKDLVRTVRFEAFEEKQSGDAFRDLAELSGVRVVMASEGTVVRMLNTRTIKSVTGGEPFTVARKFGHPFELRPNFKLWLTTNALPQVEDDSLGFWRRVILVPFDATFQDADRDLLLEDKLKAEAQGILAWAVRGAVAWRAQGLAVPDHLLHKRDEYRKSSDPVGEFIEDECDTGPAFSIGATELYQAYVRWAEKRQMAGPEILTATKFGRRMGDGFTPYRTKSGRGYEGIQLAGDGFEAPFESTGDGFGAKKDPPPTRARIKEVSQKPVTTRHPSPGALAYCQATPDCVEIIRAYRPCPTHGIHRLATVAE